MAPGLLAPINRIALIYGVAPRNRRRNGTSDLDDQVLPLEVRKLRARRLGRLPTLRRARV